MSYSRRHYHFRNIITLFAATAFTIFCFTKLHQANTTTIMASGTLSHLAVSIRKSASNDLTFSVTNNHDEPITLLRWESPLDPLAVKLGKVKLFAPADSKEALDIPIIMVRRKMPPGQESLVTIEPGATAESTIELREPLVPVDKLKGDVKVSYQGRWVSAWQKRADKISPKELEDLNAGEEALSGDYSMEPVTLNF